MTIYRCDKCKKEFPEVTDICRIRMMSETCEYDGDTPVWYPYHKTIYYDVCTECAKNIFQTFVDVFKEEGAEDND